MNVENIPALKIYSDKIVKFNPRMSVAKTEQQIDKAKLNLQKEKLTGILSDATKRNITQKLDLWISTLIEAHKQGLRAKDNKSRIPIFITITLSDVQTHDDNSIKQNMLKVFIEKLKYHHNTEYVFWRAEKQKNGNLHFHIITDQYISFKCIQRYWNDIQRTNGYLTKYFEAHNHYNAPSTHVKSVKDVQNFVKYVIKYATKSEGDLKVSGRIWGMTDKLRDISNLTHDLDPEIWAEIQLSQLKGNVKVFSKDYFSVYFLKKNILDDKDFSYTSSILRTHYVNTFNNLYNKSEFDITCQEDVYEVQSQIDDCFDNECFETNAMLSNFNSDLFGYFPTQQNDLVGKPICMFH